MALEGPEWEGRAPSGSYMRVMKGDHTEVPCREEGEARLKQGAGLGGVSTRGFGGI